MSRYHSPSPPLEYKRFSFGAQDLFKVLGDELTFKLMKQFGGRYINVPKRFVAGRDYRLLDVLTEAEFTLLVTHYADVRLLIPKYDKVSKQMRDHKIRALRMNGMTHERIAEMFRLSVRQVYTIAADDPAPDMSYDLFDGSMGGLF